MAKAPTTGRDSIYRGKDRNAIIKGAVTPKGRKAFEQARKSLAKKAKRETASDGDTIEYLALDKKLPDE